MKLSCCNIVAYYKICKCSVSKDIENNSFGFSNSNRLHLLNNNHTVIKLALFSYKSYICIS